MPHLAGLAVSVPPYRYSQSEIYECARSLFAEKGKDLSPFESAFKNTNIDWRHSAAPLEWFWQEHGWRDRNSIYLETSRTLLRSAAKNALQNAGIKATEVTDIITVSTTGIATPSLEASLMDEMEFRHDVRRTPIFGLGCAGGLMGLNRAVLTSKATGGVTLLLVVELCTLSFMRDEISKQNIIATALFADGAAAAVVDGRSGAKGPEITLMSEHRWPNSLDVMGWDVGEGGFEVIFSRRIPDMVKNEFREVFESFLDRERLSRKDIVRFLSHPGGAKVIDELESLFNVAGDTERSLVHSRSILREYGNMSAPTVLFVLEKAMQENLSGRSLLTTFGPGFSSAVTVLEA